MDSFGSNAGIAKLTSRARTVTIVVVCYVVAWSMLLIGNVLESTGTIDMNGETIDPLTSFFAMAYIAAFLVFVVSVIFVARWIYLANANVLETGYVLEITPGWAVGWFFVPLANLIQPFFAMRALWFASRGRVREDGDGTPAVLGWWWGTWLVGNGLSNVGASMAKNGATAGGGLVSAISAGLLIGCAILLLKIVRTITAAQENGNSAAAVFA